MSTTIVGRAKATVQQQQQQNHNKSTTTAMAELGGPTYAPLTPANPTIINGLAAVDVQGQHLAGHPQQVMGGEHGHGLVNMVAAAVLPAAAAPPDQQQQQQQQTAAALANAQDGQASAVDRNTLVAVLQFLKKNSMKVRPHAPARGGQVSAV